MDNPTSLNNALSGFISGNLNLRDFACPVKVRYGSCTYQRGSIFAPPSCPFGHCLDQPVKYDICPAYFCGGCGWNVGCPDGHHPMVSEFFYSKDPQVKKLRNFICPNTTCCYMRSTIMSPLACPFSHSLKAEGKSGRIGRFFCLRYLTGCCSETQSKGYSITRCPHGLHPTLEQFFTWCDFFEDLSALIKDNEGARKEVQQQLMQGTDKTCAICLEEILAGGNYFGLLYDCSHVFCFSCIQLWVKQDGRCPVCRVAAGPVLMWPQVPSEEKKLELFEKLPSSNDQLSFSTPRSSLFGDFDLVQFSPSPNQRIRWLTPALEPINPELAFPSADDDQWPLLRELVCPYQRGPENCTFALTFPGQNCPFGHDEVDLRPVPVAVICVNYLLRRCMESHTRVYDGIRRCRSGFHPATEQNWSQLDREQNGEQSDEYETSIDSTILSRVDYASDTDSETEPAQVEPLDSLVNAAASISTPISEATKRKSTKHGIIFKAIKKIFCI